MNKSILFSAEEVKALPNKREFRIPAPSETTQPLFSPGEVLYVEEEWGLENGKVIFHEEMPDDFTPQGGWCKALMLPAKLARHWIRITGIRVEHLQEITVDGILAEGITAEIPPICQSEELSPKQMEALHKMDDAGREEYFRTLARHRYMGWCSYAVELTKKFQRFWNKVNPQNKWDENPLVWVFSFELTERPVSVRASARDRKFRGRRNFDKAWLYGNLVIDKSGNSHIVPCNFFSEDGHHLSYDDDTDLPVFIDQETVGEYVSRRDVIGTPIYTGDVVRCVSNSAEHIYVVVWDPDESGFKATNGNDEYGSDFVYFSNCEEIEVIGNVYDDPELLPSD